ncbi:MAG: purine phosphoribosyltransferase family protein [Opitutaceae bacterium]|nr:purine phosphoribosyltransferase family protein [Opitutaceae bacterium]
MDYLRLIDRSKLHYKRSDVTPIFAEPAAFAALVDDLVAPWRGDKIERVVGTDALGFIVGTAIALQLGVGFVPVRKGGKLPVKNERVSFLDYSGGEKTFELRAHPWPPGTRVLLTDEWIETGATARAAVELIERAGGVVAGIAAIAFRKNEKTAPLWAKYRCHGVWPEQA